MQVKIIRRDSFLVMGKIGQGKISTDATWIQSLWNETKTEFETLSYYAKREVNGEIIGLWGITNDCSGKFLPCQEKEGEYMAGIEVDKNIVLPDGWTVWEVPAFTYLVVECRKKNYKRVVSYILVDYMTTEYFRLVGAIQEFYDYKENSDMVTLYFPIERL